MRAQRLSVKRRQKQSKDCPPGALQCLILRELERTPKRTPRVGLVDVCVCLNCYLFTDDCAGSEKAMAPHSSTLAWKSPWAEEPGRLQSMGSLRVGHD